MANGFEDRAKQASDIIASLEKHVQFLRKGLDGAEELSEEQKAKVDPIKPGEIEALEKKNGELTKEIEVLVKKLNELEGDQGSLTVSIPGAAPASKKAAAGAAQADTKKKAEAPAKQPKAPKQKKGEQGKKEENTQLDVSRLDMRVGKIVEIGKHPDADALYLEKIDCGEESGPRTVVSGLVNHVPIEEMQNRMVVVMCNLKPAKMRGVLSQAMVMCASNAETGKVEVLIPPAGAKPGDRVVVPGYEDAQPDAQLNPKKKIFEQIKPDLYTDDQCVATYKGIPWKIGGETCRSATNKKAQIS
eukprot:Nk52_evm1s2464 gene=Nk52_evmTU1s2464